MEECKLDEHFASKLVEHYVSKNIRISNEEANVRIFGDEQDPNKRSNNRKEINRQIDRLIV
jgi:hypothetical protein